MLWLLWLLLLWLAKIHYLLQPCPLVGVVPARWPHPPVFAEKACLSLHFSLSLNAAMPVKTRKVAIMGFRAVGKMIVMESISLLFSVQGSLHSLYSLWRIILLTRTIQPLRIVRQILIDMKSLSPSLQHFRSQCLIKDRTTWLMWLTPLVKYVITFIIFNVLLPLGWVFHLSSLVYSRCWWIFISLFSYFNEEVETHTHTHCTVHVHTHINLAV